MKHAAETQRRELDTDGIRDLLYDNLEHPRWEEVAERCLSCGNCTLVCPTCFCSTTEDTTDLAGDETTRVREWDSCFSLDHSYIHGGSVRSSGRSRYRQWMTHKLAGWIDQFGTSGCVGCGRCITWCPVAIDITEEAAAIRGPMRTIEDLLAENPALRQARARASRARRRLRPQSRPSRPASTSCARAIRPTASSSSVRAMWRSRFAPQRGAMTIETIHDGDLLGWSWLVPPYRTAFDARALGTIHAIAFDGACLRGKLAADPAWVMTCCDCSPRSSSSACRTPVCGCWTSTARGNGERVRGSHRRRTGRDAPGAVPGGPRSPRDTRHVDARARACRPALGDAAARFAPGQFAMLYAFGVGEAPISISDHTPGRASAWCTPSVPSAPSPRRCALCGWATQSACEARTAQLGRCRRPWDTMSSSSPAESAWRRFAPPSTSARPSGTLRRRGHRRTAGARRTSCSMSLSSSAGGRASTSRCT